MKLGKILKEYVVWILLFITLSLAAYAWWQDRHQVGIEDGSDLLADKVLGELRPQVTNDTNEQGVKIPADQLLFERHLYTSQLDLFSVPNAVEDHSPASNIPAPIPVVTSAPVTQPIALVPTAPPLPFTYVGKLIQDGKLAVFIGMQGRDMLIKKDETIAQTYHVDDISATEVKMTYIPLQIQQILKLESLN
jgi:hypothetical protein